MDNNKVWILIIDDEEDIRRIVREALSSRLGAEVRIVESHDGLDAAQKLAMQAFDCIITDLNMPRKNGGQFIKAVTESQFNAKTPVIVLTGYPDESIMDEFAHITMLEKPIRAKALTEEVQKQLKLGRTDQRVAAHLLNDFLTGVQSFLQSSLGSTPLIEAPKMKAPNLKLSGEYICSLVIENGKTVGRFALGFDRELLEGIAKKLLKHESVPEPEKVAKVLGNMLFATAVQNAPGSNSELVELLSFSSENHKNYRKLLETKGIIVEINTEYGKAYAQALSGDEKILSAA
ncbi:MAG: response regulator [Bdellovibrionales bacterium]